MKAMIRMRLTRVWMVKRRAGRALAGPSWAGGRLKRAAGAGRLVRLKRSAIHWSTAQRRRRKMKPMIQEPIMRRGSTLAVKTLLLSRLIPGMRKAQRRGRRIFRPVDRYVEGGVGNGCFGNWMVWQWMVRQLDVLPPEDIKK